MSMNRNQRRLNEKAAGKKPGGPTKKAQEQAEQLKAEGMALKNAGKEAQAIPLLAEALHLDPSLADVHFALAMMARTKPELGIDLEAINRGVKNRKALKESYQKISIILNQRKLHQETLVCQEEICRLFPEDMQEKANLGIFLNLIGKREEALRVTAELMIKSPQNKTYKALFANAFGPVFFEKEEPAIRKALQSCFDNIYESNLSKAFVPWIAAALRDPGCKGLAEADTHNKTEESFENWIETTAPDKLRFLQSEFFLDGVRLLIIPDPLLESFLRRMRRWLCLNAVRLAAENRLAFFEPFLCAMGEQCFYNEYVYSDTPEEMAALEKLDGLTILQRYALTGCYRPLFETFPDQEDVFKKLAHESGAFAKLVETQFFNPLEERRIKSAIQSFGVMENEVSRNVQNQYEENPYPRWVSVAVSPEYYSTGTHKELDPMGKYNVLVAGCGTGRHAIGTAAAYPNSKVTAIDLSRVSLAYARRKANESGIGHRIDFVHADILNMGAWPEQFDIIESSGVLHHMEDPFKGWQTLTSILKPGGFFKVGLYSETARKTIVEGRNFAVENGFPPTLEGIRACRDAILALPPAHEMRKRLPTSLDFYGASVIRDLLFHVQEHRMTLPQIQDMMKKLNLSCAGFIIGNTETLVQYDAMFPGDAGRKNMDNWHVFEQKYPDTFGGMYQFWCQKAG